MGWRRKIRAVSGVYRNVNTKRGSDGMRSKTRACATLLRAWNGIYIYLGMELELKLELKLELGLGLGLINTWGRK